MKGKHGTFATHIGCMDGRVQEAVASYAREKFGVVFVDTITEAGVDSLLANAAKEDDLYKSIKDKVEISTKKHHSQGIIVEGHGDCAGNPVSQKQHIEDIKNSVAKIKAMVGENIPVQGIYVTLIPETKIEEV